MSPTDTVSIIVPLYNACSYLPACIQSVLDQTYPSWELILINDGSTDGSGELCDVYSQADPRIRVIHQNNCGVSAARNKGIRAARGSYTCFMDSDDSIEPSMLADMITAIKKTNADCIVCGLTYDFEMTGDTRPYTVQEGRWDLPLNAHAYRELSEGRMLNSHCGKLFKTSILEQYAIHMDESLSVLEDGIFVLDYLSHAASLYCLPTAPYHYRQTHASSLQKRYHPDAPLAWVQYAQKHISFIEHSDDKDTAGVYTMLWRRYRGFLTDVYTVSGLPTKEKYRMLRDFMKAAHEVDLFRSISARHNRNIRGKLAFLLGRCHLAIPLHLLLLLRHSHKS